MKTHRISVSARIKAAPALVHGIVADYRDGHWRILPPRWFRSLVVEQGGFGAGTIIRVAMRVLGRSRTFRAAITEPDPGRVLIETDVRTGTVTTFHFAALVGDTQVTITTEARARGGVSGLVGRWVAGAFLRRVYREELARLAALAEERARMPATERVLV